MHSFFFTNIYILWYNKYDDCGKCTVFDDYGNLTKIRTNDVDTTTYTYEVDKLTSMTNGQSTVYFGYDQYGYPTHYKVSSLDTQPNMTWDMGRLKSYGEVSYKYNTSGIRLEKTSGGVSKRYITSGERVLAEYWSDGTKVYYTYDNVGPNMLILITPNHDPNASASSAEFAALLYYLKRDAHGNITEIFNSDGTCRGMYQYDAWGNHTVFDGDGKPLDHSTDSDKIAFINPFRYRGYYYDDETGLYYLNARYYDSETRRFISPDTYDYLDPTSTHGLNLYLYCANDPVNYYDPTGHFVLSSFLISLGIFTLIGASVGAVSYAGSELLSYAITGEFSWSWASFAGNVLGGAIGGAFSSIPIFGTVIAAGVSGFASTAIGMGLENAWEGKDYTFDQIKIASAINGVISLVAGKLFEAIPIKGITSGRGSYSAISKQITTKFFNGTIKRIRFSTFSKMLTYNIFGSLLGTGISTMMESTGFNNKVFNWYLGK